MSNRNSRVTVAVAISIATLGGFGGPSLAIAQEADQIEEILVTARKREESLQEVPLAITAIDEMAINERSISNLQDIADFTPGFDFSMAFGRQDFRPAIRGQSTILGGANASLYVDGIFIGRGGPTFPVSALQRVEVVKGPQSALYGRRALSGAINYVLKAPTDEFQGDTTLEVGDDALARLDLTMSGPLTDNIGYMLSASHYSRDGQYRNNFQGNELGAPIRQDLVGGQETNSIALVLDFQPTDQLSIRARAIYEESDDDSYPLAIMDASNNNCFRVGVDQGSDGNPLEQPLPPAGTPEADANLVGSAGYNGSGYYCGSVAVDNVIPDGTTNLETGFFDKMGNQDDHLRLGLRFDYDMSNGMNFVSNTGLNTADSRDALDQTNGGGDTIRSPLGIGSPFAVWPFSPGAPPTPETRIGFILEGKGEFEEFSQEFRLSSSPDQRFRWLVGAYYYSSETSNNSQLVSSAVRQGTVPGSGLPIFSPFNPTFTISPQSFSPVFEGGTPEVLTNSEVTNWAIFGSAELDIGDRMRANLELRYNEDDVKITGGLDNLNFSETFDAVLPRFTLDYQISDSAMLYGVYAEGNKPGSINTSTGVADSDRAVDEETATTFEIGAKTQWLDGRLTANVSAYYIDWEDQQLTQTRTATVSGQARTFSILDNVGESEVTGLELDLRANLTDFWDLNIVYAYTDTEIKSFIQSVDAGASAPSSFREAALIFGYQADGNVNISGTQLPLVSENQLTISNRIHGNIGSDWTWFARADYISNSERYAQVYNLASTGDREIINARVGFGNEKADIEIWARNLTGDDTPVALLRYVSPSNGTFNPFDRAIVATLPEKQSVGVTFRFRF